MALQSACLTRAQNLQTARYRGAVRRFLDENGIDASVVKMNGAVELAPRLGIAPFICDLVSTGATLEANGLVPTDTVLESEAVLVRTLKPLPPEKTELGDNLLRRLEGVLATQESKYIMLNAPEEALAHLPPDKRGLLGPPSQERMKQVRSILAATFTRALDQQDR